MTNNIGLILDPNSLQNIKSLSIKAEEYGFHSLWVTELFRSSFEQLVFVSQCTNKINIGSAVTLAFTRSPLINVLSALDIDEISQGRLILGIGSGAINTNRKWHGNRNFDKPSDRIESFYKTFRAIESSIVSKKDLIYKDENYDLEIKSFRRPFNTFRNEIPLFLAAIGPKMTNISKKLFQGHIGHVVCSKSYIKSNISPILGENRENFTKSSIILCSINNNKKKAINDAKGTIAFYTTVKAYSKPFIELGFEKNIKKIRQCFFEGDINGMINNVSNEMVENFAICGSPDEAKEQLVEYKEFVSLPILSAPHYYLDDKEVEEYQNQILLTFKI
ncbi:MAG: LLM class flavin-dependent oxidoreductase [Thermodesulfobacteriota bacterium]|nr:LLM class flavin-dependent oxidoreductase [Thermodesulfobacteriota bacterium]